MNFKQLHPNFRLPQRATDRAGGYDIYMPEPGDVSVAKNVGYFVGLGFAAEVPEGHVALLLPRSGVGAKHGVMLNNTCGVIDADYRGEWMAYLRVLNNKPYAWSAGDRVLQYIIVPVATPEPTLVRELSDTSRGEGGFGSTGMPAG